MSIKVINQVMQTNDYNLFKKLEGNRNVNRVHVKRLTDNFKTKYLVCPIIVNQDYEVIDGQHRLEAAKQLELPVNFIICNDYGLQEVQLLNSNTSNWKKVDYLNAFCDLGYPEYLKFKIFMDSYPDFGIAASEAILTGLLSGTKSGSVSKDIATNASGSMAVKYFENGDLEIPDFKLSKILAQKILQIQPFYDGFNRASFVRAMLGVLRNENYDHDVFINRLKMQPNALYHCSNVGQYKQLIEDIFNYRSRSKVSLKF